MLQTWRPGATVFQQISVRLDLGLSLLTMATAGGLAAILEQSRSQTAALVSGLAKLQGVPATPQGQPQSTAVAGAQARTSAPRPPAGASVHMHRSVPFYLIDDEYVATVNGKEVKASTTDLMKLRISSALNGENPA
ncbi:MULTISPECIES: hypothetical protein [unclassified Bosea (in: a-proteobacteria)]|uniref:hypothetical protein n=2 Tax=unclassified Bosea (in: a-proteobacteria) TaxID=2653178 RepID=UPI0012F054C0|nr:MULTISPECIES: hypothetical protein [unclassified Bosea (in: a-proteobacteria)]CAD5255955.1 hypothetical protein BOSE7B_120717 [Bosea sp. 7B]CAD5275922.1 hypothetical protein BOSE46_30057 [Bosea sp. 46]VXC16015.1 hypothetical protein BOSE127_170358 [Bosea sp. 127]